MPALQVDDLVIVFLFVVVLLPGVSAGAVGDWLLAVVLIEYQVALHFLLGQRLQEGVAKDASDVERDARGGS